MAFITCPECLASISDETLFCPYCGYPIVRQCTALPMPPYPQPGQPVQGCNPPVYVPDAGMPPAYPSNVPPYGYSQQPYYASASNESVYPQPTPPIGVPVYPPIEQEFAPQGEIPVPNSESSLPPLGVAPAKSESSLPPPNGFASQNNDSALPPLGTSTSSAKGSSLPPIDESDIHAPVDIPADVPAAPAGASDIPSVVSSEMADYSLPPMTMTSPAYFAPEYEPKPAAAPVKSPKKKSRKKLIIILSIVLVVLLLACGAVTAFLILKDKDKLKIEVSYSPESRELKFVSSQKKPVIAVWKDRTWAEDYFEMELIENGESVHEDVEATYPELVGYMETDKDTYLDKINVATRYYYDQKKNRDDSEYSYLSSEHNTKKAAVRLDLLLNNDKTGMLAYKMKVTGAKDWSESFNDITRWVAFDHGSSGIYLDFMDLDANDEIKVEIEPLAFVDASETEDYPIPLASYSDASSMDEEVNLFAFEHHEYFDYDTVSIKTNELPAYSENLLMLTSLQFVGGGNELIQGMKLCEPVIYRKDAVEDKGNMYSKYIDLYGEAEVPECRLNVVGTIKIKPLP